MKRLTAIGIVGTLTFVPAIATAQDQPWLADRRYTQGEGIRAGDFEIHPGAAAEFGFESNYLHRDDGSVVVNGKALDEKPISSLRLRITPSFSVASLGEQRASTTGSQTVDPTVTFSAAVSATYNEFFPLSGGVSANGDGGAADRSDFRQQRNVGISAEAHAKFFPRRPVSFGTDVVYTRLISPTNESLPSGGGGSFNRDIITASGDLGWAPGSGLFDWHLIGTYSGQFFESSDYTSLSNNTGQIETRGRWKFLPRTALIFDAKFGFISYSNDPAIDPALGQKLNSHPLRTTIGLNGQVLDWLKILVNVGWGASFYTPKPTNDFDSVIGQAELQFYLTGNPAANIHGATLSVSSISVGFQRDFFDSYIGNYFEQDRGYAALNYFYNGQFFLQVQGGAGPLRYPGLTNGAANPPLVPQATNADGWTDVLIGASLYGEYRVQNVFGIGATFKYDQMVSKEAVKTTGSSGSTSDSLAWRDIQAYLVLRYVK